MYNRIYSKNINSFNIVKILERGLKNKHKKNTLTFYNKLFKKYGYDPKSLGWGSAKGKQAVQFEVLCQIGDINNCSILDIGCGFGDLSAYIKYRGDKIDYHGIDINPEIIKTGKKQYPEIKLEVRDIEEEKLKKKFDWVFFSGISSAGCNYTYIERMLKEMFFICKKGVAINLVGGVLDYKVKELFYSDPEKIYTITRKISNRVVIRHDYAPYQFVVYIYKNEKITENKVFEEFLKESKIKLDDKLFHPKYNKTRKDKPKKNRLK